MSMEEDMLYGNCNRITNPCSILSLGNWYFEDLHDRLLRWMIRLSSIRQTSHGDRVLISVKLPWDSARYIVLTEEVLHSMTSFAKVIIHAPLKDKILPSAVGMGLLTGLA